MGLGIPQDCLFDWRIVEIGNAQGLSLLGAEDCLVCVAKGCFWRGVGWK